MWSWSRALKLAVGVVSAVGIMGAVACSGGQSSPNLPSGSVPQAAIGADYPVMPPLVNPQGDYVAKRLQPGEYPDYTWDGPHPTSFNESPQSAELVKQGKILPLEQRLPVPEDVLVIPADDEIGAYGGTMRVISVALNDQTMSSSSCYGRYGDGINPVVHICKGFDLSADGRVYTFTMRRGMRWSDGYPLTMEDVRFAWEELNFNKDYTPKLPIVFIDNVTGNPPKFEIIDDVTWRLTFDTANYTVIESKSAAVFSGTKNCSGGNPCYYTASHVYKRFHPKYGDEKDIQQLMRFHGQPDWTKLMKTMQLKRTMTGIPSIPVPTVYDPNYIYKGEPFGPYTGAYVVKSLSYALNVMVRNHYFAGVDPNGNQLPYLDGVQSFMVESREVAAFRSMNGESEMNSADLILSELPLYLANMEKGDYSLYIYRAPAGADSNLSINQEFSEDAELGQLLRTREFRTILSLGWNRAATNETVMGGLGTPQNWVPHPSTAYFPGTEYQFLDVGHDIARAKQMLAYLGYTDKDGDGYVDRKDGKGALSLYLESDRVLYPIANLLQKDWKDIGIRLAIREGIRAFTAAEKNKQYFGMSTDFYGVNPWQVEWTRLVPLVKGHPLGPSVGEYYQSRGRGGMAPDGPSPLYQPPAKENTYPIDVSGNLQKLQDLWTKGRTYGQFSPERTAIGREIFAITATEKYNINGLAYTGITRGIALKRNNFRNVPRNHAPTGFGGFTDAYYFEDGIDNVHHTGNKSKKYKSVSFLDAEYWQ